MRYHVQILQFQDRTTMRLCLFGARPCPTQILKFPKDCTAMPPHEHSRALPRHLKIVKFEDLHSRALKVHDCAQLAGSFGRLFSSLILKDKLGNPCSSIEGLKRGNFPSVGADNREGASMLGQKDKPKERGEEEESNLKRRAWESRENLLLSIIYTLELLFIFVLLV